MSTNETKSYWLEIGLPSFDPLKEDISADIIIVGAGITGITAAYLLTKEGLKVALIEAGKILHGTTGHTTAKITAQHRVIYHELISHFGEEKAQLYYQSHIGAMEWIRQTAEQKGIDCDFSREDAYIYTIADQYEQKIHSEWEAYQKLGIDGEIKKEIPFNIGIKTSLVMKNQAQFHPVKFLKALLDEAVRGGCKVYENTTAMDVEEDETSPKVITRDGYKLTGKKLIVASHFPYCDKLGLYFARMYAERSYAIAIKAKGEYPGGVFISVDKPTRSIRSTPLPNGETLVIIGGENHKTGQGPDTMEHYQALEGFAVRVFGVSDPPIYRWSAQDLVTLDKVPYIGPITEENKNILVATGYKKWGMTTGILAADLLKDYALNHDNPYQELYSPARFTLDPSLKKLFTTNADVAGQLIKGKLEISPVDPEKLNKGEGSVVMHNGKRAGGYRDELGKLFIVDTSCTHLGCETQWNHAEKTWDCPCHGSRYSYTGEVIEGPAVKPLTNYTQQNEIER